MIFKLHFHKYLMLNIHNYKYFISVDKNKTNIYKRKYLPYVWCQNEYQKTGMKM